MYLARVNVINLETKEEYEWWCKAIGRDLEVLERDMIVKSKELISKSHFISNFIGQRDITTFYRISALVSSEVGNNKKIITIEIEEIEEIK